MTLKDLGHEVNFTYYPVHNWNPEGGYECSYNESGVVHSLDCESTRYDGCMSYHYCYEHECDQATQLRIANFLQCFEGHYANTETTVNSSRRKPCFQKAGLDIGPVQACYDDNALASRIESQLNVSKGNMMASLGANPGTFPHIFINGQHQWNYSWCALTRTLCGLLDDKPDACHPEVLSLEFKVASSIMPAISSLSRTSAAKIIEVAAGVAVSAAALPNNFDNADPKYVDVNAITGVRGLRLKSDGNVEIETSVLKAFAGNAMTGVPSDRFRAGLAAGFREAGISKISASDISAVRISREDTVTIV